ncbi:MAG TPA: hypothetical protein VMU24_02600 [Candidatus Acidoferrales bacterium]|nr:hypothetical protein [Candidatus Acidoferrales bacterium]
MQHRYFRFTDGPRLSAEISTLLRDGMISKQHGSDSHRVPIDARGQWSATTCDWCDRLVASAYMDNHEQFFVDLVLDEDREVYAELTRPHRCAPMIASERSNDPDDADDFQRAVECCAADEQDAYEEPTVEERASRRAVLRARFMERR